MGGGGGGAVAASRLSKGLKGDAEITLVDKKTHYEFMPSYLWIATGLREPDDIRRPLKFFEGKGIKVLNEKVVEIDPANRTVRTDKGSLSYDCLIISLGAELRPDLLKGIDHTYHTWDLESSIKLREALSKFKGGRIVVSTPPSPYRCPPAPFELAMMMRYLSDLRGIIEKTEIDVIHSTWKQPMESFGPFMQKMFRGFLEQYNVNYIGGWKIDHVDGDRKKLVSSSGDEIEYDLAVVIPPHTPALPVVNTPDLVNKRTGYMDIENKMLRNPKYDDIFGIGDVVAPTLGLGMAGVFAHFQADYVSTQLVDEIKGVHMAMSYNMVGVCVMDVGYLGAAVFCDFEKVIKGESEYPKCWVLGAMKAFRGVKFAFEKMWFTSLFGR